MSSEPADRRSESRISRLSEVAVARIRRLRKALRIVSGFIVPLGLTATFVSAFVVAIFLPLPQMINQVSRQ